MDFCDVVRRLTSWYFRKDGDVTLQTNRSFYLGDGTQVSASCFVPVGGIILWSGAIASIPTNWALCNGANGTPDLRDRFVVGAGSSYAVDATGGQSSIDIQHNHGGTTGSESSHTHGDGTYAAANDTHSHGPGTLATDSDSHSHGSGTLATDSDSHSHDLSPGDYRMGTAGSFGHATTSDSHSHDVDSGTTGSDAHSHSVDSGVTANDTHNHDVTGTSAAGSAHSHTISNALSTTQSVLNPYYALAYIMRTA